MTSPTTADLDLVTADLRVLLPATPLPWPGGYPDHAELALIDAVLSIRARYGQPHNGVRGQVTRWNTHRGGRSNDLRVLADTDPATVLTNRQILAGGRIKPDVIRDAARRLVNAGLVTAGDVLAHPDQTRAAYTATPGLSNVTHDYFVMLLGTDTIKPDTWILRYLNQLLGHNVTPAQATALITTAAQRLDRPARDLDHQIWQHMRSRRAAVTTIPELDRTDR